MLPEASPLECLRRGHGMPHPSPWLHRRSAGDKVESPSLQLGQQKEDARGEAHGLSRRSVQ